MTKRVFGKSFLKFEIRQQVVSFVKGCFNKCITKVSILLQYLIMQFFTLSVHFTSLINIFLGPLYTLQRSAFCSFSALNFSSCLCKEVGNIMILGCSKTKLRKRKDMVCQFHFLIFNDNCKVFIGK